MRTAASDTRAAAAGERAAGLEHPVHDEGEDGPNDRPNESSSAEVAERAMGEEHPEEPADQRSDQTENQSSEDAHRVATRHHEPGNRTCDESNDEPCNESHDNLPASTV